MGMYDRIYSMVQLPDCELPTAMELQTKDLECLLDCYVIDAEGRLLLCRTLPDGLPDLAGAEDTGYHGDLCFYTFSEPRREPHEFLARFTHGRLEWVRRNPEGERAWLAPASPGSLKDPYRVLVPYLVLVMSCVLRLY